MGGDFPPDSHGIACTQSHQHRHALLPTQICTCFFCWRKAIQPKNFAGHVTSNSNPRFFFVGSAVYIRESAWIESFLQHTLFFFAERSFAEEPRETYFLVEKHGS
eukprot:1394318-Amorphochlora_amoeboformis.AAC.1